MKSFARVGIAALVLPTVVLAYVACSSEPTSGTTPSSTTTSTSPTTTTPTSTTTTPSDDSGPPPNPLNDAGCTYPKPEMDGGGLCGTRPFGSPAAVLTDAGASFPSDAGSVLPPGAYDVTSGERATGLPYNWRETLVIDGQKYTQIRKFDANQGTAGVTTYRSGTYTVANNRITLNADCAFRDDAGIDGGSTEFTYDVITEGCKTTLRLITAGTQLRYTRR